MIANKSHVEGKEIGFSEGVKFVIPNAEKRMKDVTPSNSANGKKNNKAQQTAAKKRNTV
jgi:hypothetical protein